MKNSNLRTAEKDFWGQLAKSQGPEFFLTVTLNQTYADSVAVEAFKHGMRALQKRIPSHRVLRGLATLERTWKKAAFEDCLHLHALLWGVVGNMREPEAFMTSQVHKAFLRLKDSQGRPMTRPTNIDLQYVYDPSGATVYTSKDLRHSRRRSRVWLITPKGFDTSTDYFI